MAGFIQLAPQLTALRLQGLADVAACSLFVDDADGFIGKILGVLQDGLRFLPGLVEDALFLAIQLFLLLLELFL